MKTTIVKKVKKTYFTPVIETIQLDNEIALVLESPTPDTEPTQNLTPEYFNNDPFKMA
jgi:hypothetical protein